MSTFKVIAYNGESRFVEAVGFSEAVEQFVIATGLSIHDVKTVEAF